MEATVMPEATENLAKNDQNDESPGYSATNEVNAPKRRGRKPGSTTTVKQTETLKKIRTTLELMFGTASGLMGAAGGKIALDGVIIRQGSPALIDALIVLCEQDKHVREFFISLGTGSAYANVVIAAMPMVIGIMANHNLIPPIFGTPAPVAMPASPNGIESN